MSKVHIAELKAACSEPHLIESLLESLKADFKGTDHQVDSYYKVPEGKLKIREGNVENTLIRYQRVEVKGIKKSNVDFVRLESEQVSPLKSLLSSLYPTLVVVDKMRKIFFIDHVKFHVDQVENLGSFVEIEAIGPLEHSYDDLLRDCQHYMKLFHISEESCIDGSYADLLLSI